MTSTIFRFLAGIYVPAFLLSVPCADKNDSSIQPDAATDINIHFEIKLSGYKKDSLLIYIRKSSKDSITEYAALKAPVSDQKAIFNIQSNSPVHINTIGLFPKNNVWLAEPGDSTVTAFDGRHMYFAGKGYRKHKIAAILDSIDREIAPPGHSKIDKNINLQEFITAQNVQKRRLQLLLQHIDQNKKDLSAFAYKNMRVSLIKGVYEDILDKFYFMMTSNAKNEISNQELCNLFDDCFSTTDWKWALTQTDYLPGWYAYIRALVGREHNFDYSSDSMKDAGKRRILYYNKGSQVYHGRTREIFLANLITSEGMLELGFTPEIQYLLKKYYGEPRYAGFKYYVKNVEAKATKIQGGQNAPAFQLTNKNGQSVSSESFVNKILLLDFWFTGCIGCVQTAPILANLEHQYKNDSNVLFINISIDRDRKTWLESLQQKKYTSGSGVSLYTGGVGDEHEIINRYIVKAYPSLFLINENGKIETSPTPDPRNDSGKMLKQLIDTRLERMKDGPYVLHEKETYTIYKVNNRHPITQKRRQADNTPIEIDIEKSIMRFPLKRTHAPEPSTYAAPPKMLVVSDIEGNLQALKRLLKSNGVIDDSLSWKFSDGHLVLAGDFFDRGEQVTECLWLIYALEEQAKKAGGYVHFLLGNHEIMNIRNDLRYVHKKYSDNAQILNIPVSKLYGSESELGRWLRSKNIMEKVGNILFVHGGVSNEINSLPMSIEQINQTVQLNIDKEKLTDPAATKIFNSNTSPFWYRLYYKGTENHGETTEGKNIKASMAQINRTLEKFGATRIITGHTIISDTISSHFNGKVINVDTRHEKGASEALLITNTGYYRVNQSGERILLHKL